MNLLSPIVFFTKVINTPALIKELMRWGTIGGLLQQTLFLIYFLQ